MNKTFALLATFGLTVALPLAAAKADGHMKSHTYAAFDLGFASLDHEVFSGNGVTIEPGGTSINLNAAIGYRAPLGAGGGAPLFFGGELSFGFGTLDEESPLVDMEDALDLGGSIPVADVVYTQTFTAEESWNITLAGDIGYVINPQALAFLRIGYVFAGGADVSYSRNVTAEMDGMAITDPEHLEAYEDYSFDDSVSESEALLSEADNSFIVGVGGEYKLADVAPGLSARGLFTYAIGDRSGFNLRVGAGWEF